jgi:trimethylamine--corrinoid protein Co-methyltransferase
MTVTLPSAPRVLPVTRWREPFAALDDEGIARIHGAALEVLDRVGVVARSASVRRELAAAGLRVDEATERVRFRAEDVEQALRSAPRAFTLAARDPAADLALDGAHAWLSLDGSAAEMVDFETGRRRASGVADVEAVSRLADALPEIGFLWQAVEAGDRPVAVRPLHELRAQLVNSSKHIQLMTAVDPLQAEGAVAMARAVAGGEDALRSRPLLSAFEVSLSPLTFEGDALEAAVVYGSAGVPCGFVVMPIACATAPATPAGVLVLSHAEALAGITILETLVPGAPTFYGACSTTMDLRTALVACGGPEDLLYQVALTQLAHAVGVPASIGTFATGSKSPDWQAGLENGLSGLASFLAGADMCSGAGLLHAARVYSLDDLVLDTEIWGLVAHFARGIALSDDDLAVEVIAAVGPAGDYLTEDHTLAHLRGLWQPRYFDRGTWEDWEASGRPTPSDRAHERVRALLDGHVPLPLPGGIATELDAIVDAFSARAGVR